MSKSKMYGLIAVLTFVVLGAGWYFGSPRWTLHQMQSAAQANDADKLSSYIDYPALRTSLKEQMKAKMAAEMMKTKDDNPFGALGAALAVKIVDGMIDGFVTPASLRNVFANASEPTKEEGKLGVRSKDLKIEQMGMDEFRLVDPTDKAAPSIIFKREGLGWKMMEIRLADEG